MTAAVAAATSARDAAAVRGPTPAHALAPARSGSPTAAAAAAVVAAAAVGLVGPADVVCCFVVAVVVVVAAVTAPSVGLQTGLKIDWIGCEPAACFVVAVVGVVVVVAVVVAQAPQV